MGIYREGPEIRVERSEKKARGTGWVAFAGTAGFGVYVGTMGDQPTSWPIIVGFFLFGLLLLRANIGRSDVCIIRPDQIGYGSSGGKMWWFDRAPVDFVQIVDRLIVQVRVWHRDGVQRESFVLTNFERNELVEAFEEAGIPVR